MKRKILFALLVVSMLIVAVAVPAMASSVIDGNHEVVVKSAKDTLSVLVNTSPASPYNRPLYPIDNYTCYFEGIRIPCSFLSWLWY
jgi:hypothetical protein